MNAKPTKKVKSKQSLRDTLRTEYRREDLGKGVRGKYFQRVVQGSNLVLLKPEVARAFPTTQAVNEALLGLMKAASRVAER